jgi:hypothetical protein
MSLGDLDAMREFADIDEWRLLKQALTFQ